MRAKYGILVGLGAVVALLSCDNAAHAAGPVGVAPVQEKQAVLMTEGNRTTHFSLTGGTSYLTGEAKEIVYWPSEGNHKASELTWNIDSLFMVNIGASMVVADRFEANVMGWFKAFDGDGTMDDYDWQNVGGDWTDWSHHEDTDVTDGFFLDLNVAYSFVKTYNFALKAIGGYKHDKLGWEASGGDYIYSANGFRDYSGSFADGELAISYEQTMDSLYFGLGMEIETGAFSLSGRFIYAPWVSAEATDVHYMRNIVIEDDFDEGDMIGFDITAAYDFTEKFGMKLGYSYQDYDTVQGDSEWNYQDYGIVYSSPDGAGMALKYSLVTVACVYSF